MMPIDPDGESTTTWMLRAEKAEAELAELKSKTYCAYCGAEFAIDGDAALVSEHIRTCPDHPMRVVEAERDRLREALEWYAVIVERAAAPVDMCTISLSKPDARIAQDILVKDGGRRARNALAGVQGEEDKA